MSRAWRQLLGACFAALAGTAAGQSTLHVPGNHSDIQSALTAASSGDTILVRPGLYQQHIDFLGKDVMLISTDGPEATVIQGSAGASVVTFSPGSTRAAEIRGFTIIGSGLPQVPLGGGIRCDNASPTIRENIVRGGSAADGGGIASKYGGSPLIEENLITDNDAVLGGGIYCTGGQGTEIVGNTISSNAANWGGAGVFLIYNQTTLRGNVIHSNSGAQNNGGGGISIEGGAVEIDHCTIFGNYGKIGGGVLAIGLDAGSIRNTIIWGNASDPGEPGTHGHVTGGQGTWLLDGSYSDVEAVAHLSGGSLALSGPGNITVDPMFVNGAGGDFSLTPGSACIDSGDPADPLDADGTQTDMGAVAFVHPYNPWEFLGQSLAGTNGIPQLEAQGELSGNDLVTLSLSNARAFAQSWLVLGLSELNTPFKGGVLVPVPDLPLAFTTDGFGEAQISTIWPPSVPSDESFSSQWWIQDPAGPKGFAASNALKATTP
jgi:hypothetical protein